MFELIFEIESSKWNSIKAEILSIDFNADEPELIRHCGTENTEIATFRSNDARDILIVKKIVRKWYR